MGSRRSASAPRSLASPSGPVRTDQLATVLAHEIRNPLCAVKLALQAVELTARLEGPNARRLTIALREVGQIERILSRLLDWARPPELALAPASPQSLIDAALGLCAADLPPHRCQVDLSGVRHLRLMVDKDRLAEALAELLRNAALASEHGVVRVGSLCDGGYLHVLVRDEGPGFTPEARARAFSPFFSTRARGIGLGLAHARAVARAHGGDVEIQAPGPGPLVAIRVPAQGAA